MTEVQVGIPGDALFVTSIRYDSGGGYGPKIDLTQGVPVTNADDASIPLGMGITDCGTNLTIELGDVANAVEGIQGTHFIEISVGNTHATTRVKNFTLIDGVVTNDVPVHVEFGMQQVINGVRQRFVVGPYETLDSARRTIVDAVLDGGPDLGAYTSDFLRQVTLGQSVPVRYMSSRCYLNRRRTAKNDGGESTGATSMDIDGHWAPFCEGMKFTVNGGDGTVYRITSSSGFTTPGATQTINFTPALTENVANNATLTSRGYASGATHLSVMNIAGSRTGVKFRHPTAAGDTTEYTITGITESTNYTRHNPNRCVIEFTPPLAQGVPDTGGEKSDFFFDPENAIFRNTLNYASENLEATGSPWVHSDRVPFFLAVCELIRRNEPVGVMQLEEMDRYVHESGLQGLHVVSTAASAGGGSGLSGLGWVKYLTDAEMHANNWLLGQGYGNTASGGFSNRFSSTIPSTVTGSWAMGTMIANPAHWELQTDCLIAMLTNDLAAARHVDAAVQQMANWIRHESFPAQSRVPGWALRGYAWALGTVGRFSSTAFEEYDQYIRDLITQTETYELLTGQRGSTWPTVHTSPPASEIGYAGSAFLQAIAAADGLSDTQIRGGKPWQYCILGMGAGDVMRVSGCSFQTFQAARQLLVVLLNTIIGQAASPLMYTAQGGGQLLMGEDNFQFPDYITEGFLLAPVGNTGGGSATGVTPRFTLPCLYYFLDYFPEYEGKIQSVINRVISEAGNYLGGPPTSGWKLSEWLWRPWGAGDTNHGFVQSYNQLWSDEDTDRPSWWPEFPSTDNEAEAGGDPQNSYENPETTPVGPT